MGQQRSISITLLFAIALSICIGGCGKSDSVPERTAVETTSIEIVNVEPSEKLDYWISTPLTFWEILDDTPHEFADDMNRSLLFGDEGLKMKVTTGLKGSISGTWTKVKHCDFLDEVCEKNNWRWDIVDSNTILISPK